jgi:hypothetical protein
VELASDKLCGGLGISEITETARLAAIMVLYTPHTTLHFVSANSLAASHMALLDDVSKSRETIQVRYPSEPVLAHGGHWLFNSIAKNLDKPERTSTFTQLESLNRLVGQGMVEKGSRGELAARFILLRALADVGLNSDCVQINYCTARQLLTALGVDLNGYDDRYRDLLDGSVHFSHWIAALGNITPQSMAMCFYRGCGIMCKPNQTAIDLFIPILLQSDGNWWNAKGGLPIYDENTLGLARWDETKITSVLSKFSGILVQVKNRNDHGTNNSRDCHDDIQTVANEIFETKRKQCISLYVQFGDCKQGDWDGVQMDVPERRSDRFERSNETEGSLRVSLFGVERYSGGRGNQYIYSEREMEQLRLLVDPSIGKVTDWKDRNNEFFHEAKGSRSWWTKRVKG